MRFVHKTNKCINRSQRCIPHRSKLERNDSPQRSCTSLALGLPTNRGGWHCPGGTAGVWTCRVSDSLQVKTTHQLRPTENNNFTLFTLSSYKTHRTQIVIFTGLSGYSSPERRRMWMHRSKDTSIQKNTLSLWVKLDILPHKWIIHSTSVTKGKKKAHVSVMSHCAAPKSRNSPPWLMFLYQLHLE